MKHSKKIAAATLLLAAASSHGALTDNWYLDFGAGGAFQQNVSIKSGTGFGPGGDVRFDPGFRIGLDLGYNLNDSFAIEFDAGMARNTINQVGIQKLNSFGANAELDEIPLLINGIYKFPLHGAFRPYVGVGIGAAISIFDSSNIPGSFFPGQKPQYSDADTVLAYQAELGFKYSVGEKVDLGLAYKFLGTTDHSWNDNNVNLKTDGTMTHAIEATLTWHF